jgi:hypothetical protein
VVGLVGINPFWLKSDFQNLPQKLGMGRGNDDYSSSFKPIIKIYTPKCFYCSVDFFGILQNTRGQKVKDTAQNLKWTNISFNVICKISIKGLTTPGM